MLAHASLEANAQKGAALMLGATVFFALMAIFTKLASRELSAAQLCVIRFSFNAILVLGLARVNGTSLAPKRAGLLLRRGICGGLAVLLYFVAIERSHSVGTATLLGYTSPIFTNLFAWALLGERPSRGLFLGFPVAFVGIVILLRVPSGFYLGLGETAALACAVVSGVAVTSTRAARGFDNAPTILLAFSLCGLVMTAPWAVGAWPSWSILTWGSALGMAVTSFCAQLLMTQAFGHLRAGEGAAYQPLTPVLTFALAVAFLEERISARAVLGAAVTAGGVFLAARPWNQEGVRKPRGGS